MFPPLRQISRRISGRSRAALPFLIAHSGLLVCGLFLLAGLVTAGDYGFSPDEANQRNIAQANWNYLLGREDGILVKTEVESLKHTDRLYGVAFELPLLLAEKALGLEDYYYVHRLRLTLTHLFFIIGGYFCYRLAYQLLGSRRIALLALLLYLLHPRLYGHSFFNSKDPVFLSMFVIALYLLERAFRRDTLGAFLLLGIGVGVLTNLRLMGAMLFPAVIAMRGLDWLPGGNGPERKHILQTAGLFTLTGIITVYALAPYAWSNPGEYLAASLDFTVNNPADYLQRFQGKELLSREMPPYYLPVWFSITTPPLILLLGVIGMAAVVVGGLRRPGAVFCNTRLRFLLLLLACFLLPPLAAALLEAIQHNGWRHSFFIYGPFGLLAALGGGWLLAALARRRRGQTAVYGLAGLGLGLVLLQLAQIHPWQHIYFNFLVDRTTPEYLGTQYELDYWELAPREGLEYLLKIHPGETLAVRVKNRHHRILPPDARQRLPIAVAGRNADYEIIHNIQPHQPDLAFNSAYRRRLYNNTLIAVRPLEATRMTPAAVAAYRELYQQAVASEPILRGKYDVYFADNRLTFVQENCPPESRDAWLGARVLPYHRETLPPAARVAWESGSYTTFGNHRVRLDDVCLAVIQLPDYVQGDLIVRQNNLGNLEPTGGPLWSELVSPSPPGLRELIADRRRNRPAAAGAADFTVFIDRAAGRNRLIYAKADCSREDYETPITLHIYPESLAALPFYYWKGGLDNQDFALGGHGGRLGGECVGVVLLPDYPIAALRTGQAGVWEVNLYPTTEPGALRAAYAGLSDIPPTTRSTFDLYWQSNRLLYLRESCAAADTAAGFFLHIIPAEVADLPAERQAAGFANLDFAFDRWGGPFDGKCLASVPLPHYPVKSLRTGQFQSEQGELWAVELPVGR